MTLNNATLSHIVDISMFSNNVPQQNNDNMFYKGMILTTEQIIMIVHNYLDIQYAIQK